MITFPPAKINLGLQILSKRQDGYHEIATCFYRIPLTDILEILPALKTTFTSSGLSIPGDPEQNLCLKAYNLIRKDFTIPPVHIHLHKVIPMGAGLGGGSSDATSTLIVLNKLFSLNIKAEKLHEYAASLGSDCPFFLSEKAMLASGTGTNLTPFSLELAGNYLYIIHPDIHVSTVEAYAGVSPHNPNESLNTILQQPENWKSILKNDFEPSIVRRYPAIGELIDQLYKSGAWYSAMSGSGSAVFGLFKEQPDSLDLPANYYSFIKKI